MSEEEKPKLAVDILHVRKYTVGPIAGPQTTLHDILFRHAELPPLLVTIPADEDTPEKRAEVIRAKIEERRAFKAERIEV